MASDLTHYRAFLILYLGYRDDHHGIFVQTGGTEKDPRGLLFHVIGNIQSGMDFEMATKTPVGSPMFLSMKQTGWVPRDKLEEVEAVARTISPPGKQYDVSRCLVPKDQIRHCQHWAAEATDALREKGVLTLLAPGESGIAYRCGDGEATREVFVAESA